MTFVMLFMVGAPSVSAYASDLNPMIEFHADSVSVFQGVGRACDDWSKTGMSRTYYPPPASPDWGGSLITHSWSAQHESLFQGPGKGFQPYSLHNMVSPEQFNPNLREEGDDSCFEYPHQTKSEFKISASTKEDVIPRYVPPPPKNMIVAVHKPIEKVEFPGKSIKIRMSLEGANSRNEYRSQIYPVVYFRIQPLKASRYGWNKMAMASIWNKMAMASIETLDSISKSQGEFNMFEAAISIDSLLPDGIGSIDNFDIIEYYIEIQPRNKEKEDITTDNEFKDTNDESIFFPQGTIIPATSPRELPVVERTFYEIQFLARDNDPLDDVIYGEPETVLRWDKVDAKTISWTKDSILGEIPQRQVAGYIVYYKSIQALTGVVTNSQGAERMFRYGISEISETPKDLYEGFYKAEPGAIKNDVVVYDTNLPFWGYRKLEESELHPTVESLSYREVRFQGGITQTWSNISEKKSEELKMRDDSKIPLNKIITSCNYNCDAYKEEEKQCTENLEFVQEITLECEARSSRPEDELWEEELGGSIDECKEKKVQKCMNRYLSEKKKCEEQRKCKDFSGIYNKEKELFQVSGNNSVPQFSQASGFRNRTWKNPDTGHGMQMPGSYEMIPEYVFHASSIGPRSEAVISQGLDQMRNNQPAMWAVSAYYAEEGCNIDFSLKKTFEYVDKKGRKILFGSTKDNPLTRGCVSVNFIDTTKSTDSDATDSEKKSFYVDITSPIRLYGEDVYVMVGEDGEKIGPGGELNKLTDTDTYVQGVGNIVKAVLDENNWKTKDRKDCFSDEECEKANRLAYEEVVSNSYQNLFIELFDDNSTYLGNVTLRGGIMENTWSAALTKTNQAIGAVVDFVSHVSLGAVVVAPFAVSMMGTRLRSVFAGLDSVYTGYYGAQCLAHPEWTSCGITALGMWGAKMYGYSKGIPKNAKSLKDPRWYEKMSKSMRAMGAEAASYYRMGAAGMVRISDDVSFFFKKIAKTSDEYFVMNKLDNINVNNSSANQVRTQVDEVLDDYMFLRSGIAKQKDLLPVKRTAEQVEKFQTRLSEQIIDSLKRGDKKLLESLDDTLFNLGTTKSLVRFFQKEKMTPGEVRAFLEKRGVEISEQFFRVRKNEVANVFNSKAEWWHRGRAHSFASVGEGGMYVAKRIPENMISKGDDMGFPYLKRIKKQKDPCTP